MTKHSDSELKLLLLLLHVGLVATTCTRGMKGEGEKHSACPQQQNNQVVEHKAHLMYTRRAAFDFFVASDVLKCQLEKNIAHALKCFCMSL